MKKLILTLRQRKLLHYLMNRKGLVTGTELAHELNVTDRTIRSDIAEINRNIIPYHAEIVAERSKGYYFAAEDDEQIHELNRIQLGFLTREERVRYLAFRLCLAKEPIHVFDLEEEMYTSYTTLKQDLVLLRRQFSHASPFIRLYQKNNELWFEQDERKIRHLLTRLVHDDWNYSKDHNAYYGYHFLKEETLHDIMNLVTVILHRHGIFLEDPALVYLDLLIAVSCERVQQGDILPDSPVEGFRAAEAAKGSGKSPNNAAGSGKVSDNAADSGKVSDNAAGSGKAANAARDNGKAANTAADEMSETFGNASEIQAAGRELFQVLQEYFRCSFPESERQFICRQISATRLPDMTNIRIDTIADAVKPEILAIADKYLQRIDSVFGIDLTGDDDFYVTLCLTISSLQNENFIFYTQGNPAFEKKKLQDEYEIACLFQEIAAEDLGRLLSETELIHLAHCIAGAFIYLFQSHPELQIRTVICSHQNMMSLWHLKRKLLNQYQTYLAITDLIPVNSCSGYDFSHTDLVLTTNQRPITDHPGTRTLLISYFLTPEDMAQISACIEQKRFERLCPVLPDTGKKLLAEACWHEREARKSPEEALKILAADFAEDESLKGRLLEDVLQREKITSFVLGRGIVFVHSMMPAEKTRLSVMTFEHRIVWNNCKIRTVILGAFRPDELPVLFHLKHLFHDLDREGLRVLKTKAEICHFFGAE